MALVIPGYEVTTTDTDEEQMLCASATLTEDCLNKIHGHIEPLFSFAVMVVFFSHTHKSKLIKM